MLVGSIFEINWITKEFQKLQNDIKKKNLKPEEETVLKKYCDKLKNDCLDLEDDLKKKYNEILDEYNKKHEKVRQIYYGLKDL